MQVREQTVMMALRPVREFLSGGFSHEPPAVFMFRILQRGHSQNDRDALLARLTGMPKTLILYGSRSPPKVTCDSYAQRAPTPH